MASLRNLAILVSIVTAAVAAHLLIPKERLSELVHKESLDSIIPKSFGHWKIDQQQSLQVIDPRQLENIKKVYTQTLSRTYVNELGQRVMLSIAYGADQRSDTAAHYPEVCYPAQGFVVISNKIDTMVVAGKNIPVRRLETSGNNQRFEPVTYWLTIGDYVTVSSLDRRLKELSYGLKGQIPDGLLFRVSTIDADSLRAFKEQDLFINELFNNIEPGNLIRFVGN